MDHTAPRTRTSRRAVSLGAASVIALTGLAFGGGATSAQAAEAGECDVFVMPPRLTGGAPATAGENMFVASNVTGSCGAAKNVRVRMWMWYQQFGEERLANDNFGPDWGGRDYGDLDGAFDLGGRQISTAGGLTSVKVRGQVCYTLPSGSEKCREDWKELQRDGNVVPDPAAPGDQVPPAPDPQERPAPAPEDETPDAPDTDAPPSGPWAEGRADRKSERQEGDSSGAFPGREAFELGQSHPSVYQLDLALIEKGYTAHHDGDGYQPSETFTEYTRQNVEDFQRDQGWSGADADGYPGPMTWQRLVNSPA